MDKIIQLSLRF